MSSPVPQPEGPKKARVVVLGGGFGGLTFARALSAEGCQVTLIDRQNHHLFQPLLYQVATSGLAAPDVAHPIRSVLSGEDHVSVVLDNVTGVDLDTRRVQGENLSWEYDYLVIALGGRTSYFGHNEWERYAPGLKNLTDAFRIRSQVLYNYERAEREHDPAVIERLLTTVVVGGGPTGVEMAGALAELGRFCLRKDFRRIDPAKTRIILIEGGDAVLEHFGDHLSDRAEEQLKELGVEIRTGVRVNDIGPEHVGLNDGSRIDSGMIIWAAGVGAVPLTQKLGVDIDRGGRLLVEPDLSLPGHPEVFAIGDIAAVANPDGSPVPGVAPAAMQMARHAAKLIGEEIREGREPGAASRERFHYHDKGSMATIGRTKAVAMVGKLHFSGFSAWFAWLGIHLMFLVGFRNRLIVFIKWFFSYLTYRQGARIFAREGQEIIEDYVGSGRLPEPDTNAPPQPAPTVDRSES